MKKIAIIILSATIVAACGSEEGIDSKRQALVEKEKALADLQDEIAELKEEIAALDTTKVEEKLTPVEVISLKKENFQHFIQLPGTVESKENVLLSAESMGRVVSIPVKEGQQVNAGTVLVKLNSDLISEQMAEAKARHDLAKTTFERRQKLWNDNIGSEIEYLQSKTEYEAAKRGLGQLQAQLDAAMIKAPISGRVDEILVNKGEFLNVGRAVVRIVDMDNLEIEAELSENYLGKVAKGDSVMISINAINEIQKQPVIFSSQFINPDNRSFKIKVSLDNKNTLIKPNLLVDLKIKDYENANALVIPANAIKSDLKGEYVYIAEGEETKSTIAKRYITKGQSFDDRTEILEGLKAGERVVVVGFNEVSEGESVSVN